jgi:hypothetical protein
MGTTSLDFAGALQWTVDFVIHAGTDFFAFVAVAAVVAAFAFYFGRDRFMPLVASLYAAIPLWQVFPWHQFITTPLVSIALYFGIALAALIAFSGLSAFLAGGSVGFIKLILLSGLTAGMILAIAIHILPVHELYTFSPPTLALFSSDQAFFIWLAAPLAGLFFFGRG